jgi:hypothetical protein
MIQKDPWNHAETNQYDTERSMDPWKLIRMIQKYPRICVLWKLLRMQKDPCIHVETNQNDTERSMDPCRNYSAL